MPAGRPASGHDSKPVPISSGRACGAPAGCFCSRPRSLVTFGAFFLTAMRVTTRAREVAVPDVRGTVDRQTPRPSCRRPASSLTRRSAPRRIRRSPADHVLSQDPEPGTVLPPPARRPRSRERRPARPRGAVGRRPGRAHGGDRRSTQASGGDRRPAPRCKRRDYPAGTVIAQDPPGRAPRGSVSLLVNRGAGGIDASSCPTSSARSACASWTSCAGAASASPSAAEVPYPVCRRASSSVRRRRPGFQVALGEPIVARSSADDRADRAVDSRRRFRARSATRSRPWRPAAPI